MEEVQNFVNACRASGLITGELDTSSLAPAATLPARVSEWRGLALAAKSAGMRWCGFWAREAGDRFEAFSCMEMAGHYLVVRAHFSRDDELPSVAAVYPAADRPERHARDLLGVLFSDQPDSRRWTRHRAWTESQFPLRAESHMSQPAHPTPPDYEYPFHQVQGAGVVEIPVGPVHAGIIEPGHFRFQAVGETILSLEERLGYAHKGIEKLAIGRDAEGLARLAGRVSGDCTVGHTWAACQAMERAANIPVPPRAHALRAVMAERERVANHLGDIGAICNDVGFPFAQYQGTRLKENWIRENGTVYGHRLLMDRIVPGGTAMDLDAGAIERMRASAHMLAKEVAELIRIVEESESVEDRLMGTGRLTPEAAVELGAVGYVGRASGQNYDLRRDAPYAPYDGLTLRVPGYRAGDVAARAKVRAEEIAVSLDLIVTLLASLPQGPHRVDFRPPPMECEGLGMVESWRGELLSYVRFGCDSRVSRFFPRDPSWLNWPALERLIDGNIVPDFPVCNKSVNGSYSGTDL